MKTILFVDNDPDFIDTRTEDIKNAGYKVVQAHTLEAAKKCVSESTIDLAIIDIRMKDDDDDNEMPDDVPPPIN